MLDHWGLRAELSLPRGDVVGTELGVMNETLSRRVGALLSVHNVVPNFVQRVG